jgi:hypothetical protein
MTNNRKTNNPKNVPNKIVNDTDDPVYISYMKNINNFTMEYGSKNKNKNEGRENNISRNARSTFYENNNCVIR